MSIYEKQNEENMICLLKAQRSLYNKAKIINAVKVSISIVLTCLFIILTSLINNDKLNATSILIVIFVFIGSYACDYFVNKNKYLAAGMQQWFDIYILDLKEPSKKYRFQKKPDLITKLKYIGKYKDKKIKNLYNWYSNYSNLSPANQILACQKTNIRWDKELRKKIIFGNLVISTIFIITILIIGICLGNGLRTYAILAWVLPLLGYIVTTIKLLYEDIKRLEEIKEELVKADEIKNEEELYMEVCDLQYYIYEHRKNAFMIPNWFYGIFRSKQQVTEDNIANGINNKEEDKDESSD